MLEVSSDKLQRSSGIRHSHRSPDTREWGMAMKGELNYVESPWAGTLWALGGTSVMVKQTLISLVVPNSLVSRRRAFCEKSRLAPGRNRGERSLHSGCALVFCRASVPPGVSSGDEAVARDVSCLRG